MSSGSNLRTRARSRRTRFVRPSASRRRKPFPSCSRSCRPSGSGQHLSADALPDAYRAVADRSTLYTGLTGWERIEDRLVMLRDHGIQHVATKIAYHGI